LSQGDDTFGWLGERVRRLALGLTAMLVVARAYYPSEDASQGTGLIWVFAILATSALGVASWLFAGTTLLRWSWADAAVLALMVLVGTSSLHAAQRRPAITMAWEWGGLGLLYFLARNLPRTRAESATLAGALVATAVAVSTYGFYQTGVEFATLRRLFEARPDLVYFRLGIPSQGPGAEALRHRLMDSNEPFSTFALANSLAGFLVGPMALAFAVAAENLRKEGRGSRAVALAMAAVPGLAILACLLLTKSRSAWVGLFASIVVLGWRSRRVVPARVLAGAGLGMVVLLGALVAAGVASGRLDKEVLSQSGKSLRFRWEYWVGAWGVITDAPSPYASTGLAVLPGGPDPADAPRSARPFWSGLGPANFAIPYLAHKLPEASEEIQDPHDMVLEVWATGGLLAAIALLAAIGFGLREILGPPRPAPGEVSETDRVDRPGGKPRPDPTAPPGSAGWLLAMAGLGWIAVWVLGMLNPVTQGDLLARWLILGAAWGMAVVLGATLWRRRPIPAAGVGLGILALAINLLAAGGIGIPSVAMMLWVLLAIGLNLRDDRPCGRLRRVGGLGPAVLLACVWAMLAGTYYGAVMPFWRSEAALEEAEAAMALRPPAFEVAREALARSIEADRFNTRPWVALADLEYQFWRSPEGSRRKEPHWPKVLMAMDKALDPKWRDPNDLGLRRRQASFARIILANSAQDARPFELIALRGTIVKACRNAARIYPTSATIRAELAEASAELGMFPDAVREAKQALLLDSLTPHLDKKLPAGVRSFLKAQIPPWEEQAKQPPPKREDIRGAAR